MPAPDLGPEVTALQVACEILSQPGFLWGLAGCLALAAVVAAAIIWGGVD